VGFLFEIIFIKVYNLIGVIL
jgi:hypothetical protein